jgi:hypothetical protein
MNLDFFPGTSFFLRIFFDGRFLGIRRKGIEIIVPVMDRFQRLELEAFQKEKRPQGEEKRQKGKNQDNIHPSSKENSLSL